MEHLYHGTGYINHDAIITNGIKPRGQGNSNWHNLPSNSTMVYLCQSNPFYYGTNAGDSKQVVVYEIDRNVLDPTRFYPDEDFLIQTKEIEKSVARYNLDVYQDLWESSLISMGTCAYQGIIPPSAISRYCVVDFDTRRTLSLNLSDGMNYQNYMYRRDELHKDIEWYFNDEDFLSSYYEAEVLLNNGNDDNRELDPLDSIFEKQLKLWEKESKDRKGITVENVNI